MGKTAENVAICTFVVQGSTYFVEEESIYDDDEKSIKYLYVTFAMLCRQETFNHLRFKVQKIIMTSSEISFISNVW